MIRLEGVTAPFPGAAPDDAPRAILRDLSAEFLSGEGHLILGGNGAGKTTLIRILAGLLTPASGRVLLDGAPIRDPSSEASLWPGVAVVFEEPDPQFLAETVEGEAAFGLESLALPPDEIRARAGGAIEAFGLRGFEGRAPQTLSAGEKARVLLAAMTAARPRALLLDQSLAHLDPGNRRALERRLLEDALPRGCTVIRTHQDSDAPAPGERLHILEEGRLLDASRFTPPCVLERTNVPLPLAMRVSAMLASRGAWNGPLAMDAATLQAGLAAGDRGVPTARWDEGSAPAAAFHPERAGAGGDAVLAFRTVSYASRERGSRTPILDGLDLEVREGSVTCLVGVSGSGKTTILKLAAALMHPTQGTIDRAFTADGAGTFAALAIEYPERQLFGRTVGEDVATSLWVHGASAEERRDRGREALEAVGLDPDRFLARVPITLSEGEKRRVAIASLLAEPPRLLLLDEPTAGLDPAGRRALARVIRDLRARGHAILVASHDLDFVSGVADRVVVLGREAGEPGRVLGEGAAPDVWRDTALLQRAHLPPPDFVLMGKALSPLRDSGLALVRDADSLLESLARSLREGSAARLFAPGTTARGA